MGKYTLYRNNVPVVTTDNINVAKFYSKGIARAKLFWMKHSGVIECFFCNMPLAESEGYGILLSEFSKTEMYRKCICAYVAYELFKTVGDVDSVIEFVKNFEKTICAISAKYAKGLVLLCDKCFAKYAREKFGYAVRV